jgi:hypothetical protein
MQLGGGLQQGPGAAQHHHPGSTSGGGSAAVQGLSLGGGPGQGSSGSQAPAPIMPGLGPAAAALLGNTGMHGLRHDGLGKASGGGVAAAGGSTGGGAQPQGIVRPSGYVMGPPKEGYMRPEVVSAGVGRGCLGVMSYWGAISDACLIGLLACGSAVSAS